MPIHTTTTTRQGPAPRGIDWNAILDAAKGGACDGINDWLNLAKLDGGRIDGPVGTLTKRGNLTNSIFKSDLTSFGPRINARIEEAARREITQGDPAAISHAIAGEIRDAWNEWASNLWFSIVLTFNDFAAYPGPWAPPTPPIPPVPNLWLNAGLSSGEQRLKQGTLADRLSSALRAAGAMTLAASTARPAGGGSNTVQGQQTLAQASGRSAMVARPGMTPSVARVGGAPSPAYANVLTSDRGSPEQLAAALATYISDSFLSWRAGASFTNILGSGPVPTYAPPILPVAPVHGGKITGDLSCQAFGL